MTRTLIFPSGAAKKKLARFIEQHPELEGRIEKVLDALLKNPRDPGVGAHKLTGQFKDFYGADVTPRSYRIVYAFSDDHVYFLNIGTHDEVY